MKAFASLLIAASLALGVTAAKADIVAVTSGKVIKSGPRSSAPSGPSKPFAMPMLRTPLPSHIDMVIAAAKARPFGKPILFPGSDGNGELPPPDVRAPRQARPVPMPQSGPASKDGGVVSDEYGGSGQVYTTSEAFYASAPFYRKAGRVNFNDGFCSGAMIKRGLVLTAAHCIWNWYNKSAYGGWTYLPAYNHGASATYGTWNTVTGFITDAYLAGNCNGATPCDCDPSGVVCTDDVAVLLLVPDSKGKYAGDYTGYFSYGMNGYSYASGQAQITQLGYPNGLDSGEQMQRTDSRGLVDASNANNTIIGSGMNPGSSGGPLLVNFGEPPVANSGVTRGSAPFANVVVGVASWYNGNRQNGASPFLPSNIYQVLYGPYGACTQHPEAC